ncbi:hypothetical protein EXIGLDRAFT_772992 [Exidia glandulosa HHB12029]|uniref:F-box domain-containing protein n=1 Tax=Exidia glandulosa HHB12029 TaxID=1314781 RepID=A0A165F0S7_EXIGL|nr:hypothetical protein EXIGLDRAFT_772992 [Exidia glandulosa HHB12029]
MSSAGVSLLYQNFCGAEWPFDSNVNLDEIPIVLQHFRARFRRDEIVLWETSLPPFMVLPCFQRLQSIHISSDAIRGDSPPFAPNQSSPLFPFLVDLEINSMHKCPSLHWICAVLGNTPRLESFALWGYSRHPLTETRDDTPSLVLARLKTAKFIGSYPPQVIACIVSASSPALLELSFTAQGSSQAIFDALRNSPPSLSQLKVSGYSKDDRHLVASQVRSFIAAGTRLLHLDLRYPEDPEDWDHFQYSYFQHDNLRLRSLKIWVYRELDSPPSQVLLRLAELLSTPPPALSSLRYLTVSAHLGVFSEAERLLLQVVCCERRITFTPPA